MTVTNFHVRREFYVTAIDGTPQVVVPDVPGDVTVNCVIIYVVQESAGGTSAGTTTCVPGAGVIIYTDGVDDLTLAVSAGGALTLQRTAGAATFNCELGLLWL